MYYNMPFDELRGLCKTTIETLEIWLRRLIDDELRVQLGENYLWFKDGADNYIFKKSIREKVQSRRQKEPMRYHRDVDALLLEEEVDIILHPNLYKDYFRDALNEAFPDGVEEARTFINRIIQPRNSLAHANSITIRQVEQIICYSNDIIDSLKKYYEGKGLEKMYNAPTIIQLTDSKGNVFHAAQIEQSRNATGRASFRAVGTDFYPGDNLRIEIEVDPSFKSEDYIINWIYTGGQSTGREFILNLNNSHVREDFTVYCLITSIDRDWHRLGDCDDSVSITYRVLPPIR